MAMISTINPTTGATIRTYAEMDLEDIETIIHASHDDFLIWQNFSFEERARPMN
jgi:succinate-semialdehyde dehydrogenase/glutarate-semialdehyde dehydrogenase